MLDFFTQRGGFVFPVSVFSLLLFWHISLFPVKTDEYPQCCLLQLLDFLGVYKRLRNLCLMLIMPHFRINDVLAVVAMTLNSNILQMLSLAKSLFCSSVT